MQSLDLYKPDSLLAKLKLVFLRAREMNYDTEEHKATEKDLQQEQQVMEARFHWWQTPHWKLITQTVLKRRKLQH